MKMLMLIVTTLIAGSGCLNGEPDPTDPAARAAQPLLAEAEGTTTDQICRSLMQRQRACGDAFIPALVDARVARDLPPGIAARERELGREALLDEALAEWAEDSRDPAIASLCDGIAQSISPENDRQLRTSVSACLAETGCDAFVTCAVPLNLVHWL